MVEHANPSNEGRPAKSVAGPWRRAIVLLWRALRLRCPACGAGIFDSWLKMRAACPGCGLVLEREEGYFTGAIGLNLMLTELLFAAGFTTSLVLTWPNPPWDLLLWGWVAFMIVFPIVCYPLSKTIWLALDLFFRPIERQEFQRHQHP
jgi:uncharacterized protein (DUF983 family)